MKLNGVLPPITTPFRDGEVDLAGLKSNLRNWLATDLAGFVVLGSNGEAQLLDEREADSVLAVAREVVPRGPWLIAGTGRESTAATVAATRRAGDLGMDAVLVRTPSAYKRHMTGDALGNFYRTVADASPIPVLLYNFAAATGVNLQPETVAVLAEHENIIGIKESGGDISQISLLVATTPADFQVVVGSAQTFYPALCVGAVGGILALSCIVPELCVRLLRLVAQADHDAARELQRRLTPLALAVTSVHGVPGLKAAMDMTGYVGGDPRLPLQPASAAVRREIEQQLSLVHQLHNRISGKKVG